MKHDHHKITQYWGCIMLIDFFIRNIATKKH